VTPSRYAAIALPLPAPEPYAYTVPPDLADRVEPGARVVVPLRERELVGIVVAVDVEPPPGPARPLLGAPDATPALTTGLLKLGHWIADYYGAPIGVALRSVLPGALWGTSRVLVSLVEARKAPWPGGARAAELGRMLETRGTVSTTALRRGRGRVPYELLRRLVAEGAVTLTVAPPRPGKERREHVLRLVGETLSLTERDVRFRRAPARRRAYEALEELGGTAPRAHLTRRLGLSASALDGLVRDQLAQVDLVASRDDPFAGLRETAPPQPTTAQQDAIAAIGERAGAGTALLQGVTGSGKTLVYLEVLRREVAADRGAIVLVPEIALTPQTVARVRGVFGDRVAVLHSALSDADRVAAWWRLRRGERVVAIGARSAVFAPLPRLGVIVVDEEHEATYKQGEAPRYHVRDVARVRAQLEGARLVLGSATPSLESWAAGRSGTLLRVALPERIGSRPLPPVQLVDLRTAPLAARGPVPWSRALDDAVGEALGDGRQALLLLNRRGFASFLQCPSCGTASQCPHCSIALTVHQTPPGLRCHYCGLTVPVPTACAACGAGVRRMRSPGTQQLEQFVAGRFPTARLARMDVDATGTRWAHHRILERVARGDVDVLVGTQMIAKGLDFPGITAVGVVDADVALHLPDFRAGERTFQLLAQVAGRTGRGPAGGRVVVQTRHPEHEALQRAAAHDVDGFLEHEWEARRVPPYPPHVALLRVLVEAADGQRAARAATEAATWIGEVNERLGGSLGVVGPAPAPLERLRGRWRWHLLVKAAEGRALGQLVRAWRAAARPRAGVHFALDRDPVTLL
jgi:primosomal protein N' (replication factor Y)